MAVEVGLLRFPSRDHLLSLVSLLMYGLYRPRGNDVEVTYLCKVSLGGSIPAGMVATVIVDVPKCAGKLRDTYYERECRGSR